MLCEECYTIVYGINPSEWEYSEVNICKRCGRMMPCYRSSHYKKKKNKGGGDFNRII